MLKYSLVIDADGTPLSPTLETKAWYMIRKKKATLVSKYPMVIQLNRSIPQDEICKDEIRCGINDGAEHVGIALVQKCQTKNKVLLKGTIEQRNDVHKLMVVRKGYRDRRRRNKRYRPSRHANRASAKQLGRLTPTVQQKRQATIRVLNQISNWIKFTEIYLEDVAFDIRALVDGFKPYPWMRKQSNRLDENIRIAVIKRDHNTCMMCGRKDGVKEAHHIRPKRLYGPDTLKNLITLCPTCHDKVTGVEEQYMDFFYKITNSANTHISIRSATQSMQGKTWLQTELLKFGNLHLTTGGDTANRRLDWEIEKTHANDAICATDLKPDTVELKDWLIKPMRRQSKAKTDNVLGIRHRDLVTYTYTNGEVHTGYVTALYPDLDRLNFQSPTKHCKKVNAHKCKLLWKFNKIYWF